MFKDEKNLAVNHGKQVCGKRIPEGKARVTWLLDVRDSREMPKKLNFKVSIGVISGYVSTLLVGVKKVKNTL